MRRALALYNALVFHQSRPQKSCNWSEHGIYIMLVTSAQCGLWACKDAMDTRRMDIALIHKSMYFFASFEEKKTAHTSEGLACWLARMPFRRAPSRSSEFLKIGGRIYLSDPTRATFLTKSNPPPNSGAMGVPSSHIVTCHMLHLHRWRSWDQYLPADHPIASSGLSACIQNRSLGSRWLKAGHHWSLAADGRRKQSPEHRTVRPPTWKRGRREIGSMDGTSGKTQTRSKYWTHRHSFRKVSTCM